jgi:hypothetical protein
LRNGIAASVRIVLPARAIEFPLSGLARMRRWATRPRWNRRTANHLPQFDGNSTETGEVRLSLRLSGQGSGKGEKFRYIFEAMGGSAIEWTLSGKWHNGYDNQAGCDAPTFYVDAVQTWLPRVPHDAEVLRHRCLWLPKISSGCFALPAVLCVAPSRDHLQA